MKKLLAILLSFTVLTALFVPSVSVYASDATVVSSPVMEDTQALSGALQTTSAKTSSSLTMTYDGHTYYTNGEALYSIVKKGLDARKETFTVYYLSQHRYTSAYAALSLAEDLWTHATEDSRSVSGTDGDYTRWAVSGVGIDGMQSNQYKDGYYYYTVKLHYTYYSSASEEAKVTTAVNQFINTVNTQTLSDEEVLRKVHDFICNSTKYNYDAVDNTAEYPYAFSAYGALIKHSCVCQGYAVAFYRICKQLGYSTRVVTSSSHAWNIVALDGKYYFVDATWDDSYLDEGDTANAYKFFLVDYADLQSAGSRFNHSLEPQYYNTDDFNERYRQYFATDSYDASSDGLLSQSTVTLGTTKYTYTGSACTPAVTVKNKNGTVLTQGTDYTLTYTNNKNTGFAKVTVTGIGAYEGSVTQRLFQIVPVAMGALSVKSKTSDSVTLFWKSPGGNVSGYRIDCYKNGAWSSVKTVGAGTLTAEITALSANKQYAFRICAYTAVSGYPLYGACSTACYAYTKPAATTLKLKTNTTSSVTLQWKKVSCSGYLVEQSKNGKWVLIKTVSTPNTTTLKVTNLGAGKAYSFRVRTFGTASGATLYGAYTNLKTATKPKTPTLSFVKAGSKSATLQWKQIICTGYQIQYSTDKNFKKNTKSVTVGKKSTVTKKITGLKKGKKYYFRLRAYKTADGKKTYSAWSKTKSVTVK